MATDYWITGRDDMQSYSCDDGEPFTNIYSTTKTRPTVEGPLPVVIGRAVGADNKKHAKMMAAAPALLERCRAHVAMSRCLCDELRASRGAGVTCDCCKTKAAIKEAEYQSVAVGPCPIHHWKRYTVGSPT